MANEIVITLTSGTDDVNARNALAQMVVRALRQHAQNPTGTPVECAASWTEQSVREDVLSNQTPIRIVLDMAKPPAVEPPAVKGRDASDPEYMSDTSRRLLQELVDMHRVTDSQSNAYNDKAVAFVSSLNDTLRARLTASQQTCQPHSWMASREFATDLTHCRLWPTIPVKIDTTNYNTPYGCAFGEAAKIRLAQPN